jgi:hypothetical protein
VIRVETLLNRAGGHGEYRATRRRLDRLQVEPLDRAV